MLSWVHFGDLHASSDDGYRSLDHLKEMIGWVNRHLSDRVDFAYLPGDNANNGTPAQYSRILAAVRGLALPLYVIPGDHDFEPGDLEAFNAFASQSLPVSRMVKGHRCIFLDLVSAGRGGPDFRMSATQRKWLDSEIAQSVYDDAPPLVFMHAYPGDVEDGASLAWAFAQANVAIVDTGHTHYNELLNDGWVVYASTRSTGQIEEDDGRPGFSVVAVDGCSVSWKFRHLDSDSPFVMITQPCDRRLHRERDASCGAAAPSRVRALVGADVVRAVANTGGVDFDMVPASREAGVWEAAWPESVTTHGGAQLTITVTTEDGRTGHDTIEVRAVGIADVNRQRTNPLGTDAHAVEAWPEHGVLGSQLGPNKNGHGW